MKKILLDTNAYIRLFTGAENVLEVLAKAEYVLISVIVLGELYAGFKGGAKELENKKRLSTFVEKPTVEIVTVSQETAEIFGEIKNKLKIAGTPLPINDLWIAAQTIETGSTLISFDNHFKKIAGLRVYPS